MRAARRAIAMAPDRPEGHFWLAADMGGYAEAHGITGGLKYRGAIRDQLERVLAIDPGFQQGSADRALGRWYLKVPGLFGGSDEKSEMHLRRALTYNPASVITHLFLAETLKAEGRREEALAELARAVELPVDSGLGARGSGVPGARPHAGGRMAGRALKPAPEVAHMSRLAPLARVAQQVLAHVLDLARDRRWGRTEYCDRKPTSFRNYLW